MPANIVPKTPRKRRAQPLGFPTGPPVFPVGMSVLVAVASACAAHPPKAPRAPSEPEPQVIETARLIVTPRDAASVEELFAGAQRLLEDGRLQEAVRDFDRVSRLDPEGPWALEAAHRAALAVEDAGQHRDAAQRFERLALGHPREGLARDALVRSIRLYLFLEEWQRGGRLGQVLLSRYEDLVPLEQIVGSSARALAFLARAELEEAQHYVGLGRRVIDEHRLDSAGVIPRDLAQVFFALGELNRLRAEAIRLDAPEHFVQRFEKRAQLLLDAQGAYSDVMRAHDAHWSAMAGYRVGELYGSLHREVMEMPRPPGADTERRRLLFEGALRLRYSVLLDKGLAMFEHTLAMAERTGEQSAWVERTQRAKRQLQQAAEAERAAIDALPFSRADLQAVLREIQGRQP